MRVILLLLMLGFSFSNSANASTVQNKFCLVNSTDTAISITRILIASKNQANLLPKGIENQSITPYFANCWPLTSSSNIKKSTIKIKTVSRSLSWNVNPADAIGEIYRQYPTIKNDTHYYLRQIAGDNNGYPTNVFILEEYPSIQEDYLSNWMKNIPDTAPLKSIQLVGTHDAGINSEDKTTCNVASAFAVTQAWGLATQLRHGIRSFDIRLERERDNQYHPYHKFYHLGCSSNKNFQNSLNDMIDFIKEHPTETIFLKISHTSPSSEAANIISMLNTFTDSASTGSYFYKSDRDDYNWSDKQISEIRGKIILLLDCEFFDFLSPQKGYFSYSTLNSHAQSINCSPDDNNKILQGHYTKSKDFDTMYKDQLAQLKNHGEDKTKLFLLYWTLTGGQIVGHVARPAAYLAILSHDTFGKTLAEPNVIYYNFEDPGINKILILNKLALH